MAPDEKKWWVFFRRPNLVGVGVPSESLFVGGFQNSCSVFGFFFSSLGTSFEGTSQLIDATCGRINTRRVEARRSQSDQIL